MHDPQAPTYAKTAQCTLRGLPSDVPTAEHSGAAATHLLEHLNTEQSQAVTVQAGHALILAGAGSGKTRVLTTRIAWLLHQGAASPSSIMAVTFTNKAAREMSTRLQAMVPWDLRHMWMGTFHGLSHRLLRRHHQAAGLPATFQILDTQDQLSAIKRLCKEHHIDTERFAPRDLQWFIAECKDEGLRPAQVQPRGADDVQKLRIYELYEQQCAREGVVDFGELMLRSYELLAADANLRAHYQSRFTHILVDEFQDTSRLQYLWLRQFAGELDTSSVPPRIRGTANVLAVGDDDQSIYAFRGARVGNMADFVRDFAVAPSHHIKLEQNYRSSGHILDAANALIEHNSERMGKNLRTTQGAGEPIRVQHEGSDMDEARWLSEEISALIAEGHDPRNIAVLYRSNAQSRVIEGRLFNAGIAYRVWGGLRFFERAEVKHALAYLRLLDNPHDDTSFLRVVNFPARGIGTRTLENLQETARATGSSLHSAAAHVGGAAGAKLGGFIAMLDVLREQTRSLNLRETITATLDASGLIAWYEKEKDGSDRIDNLRELINAAESFVMQEGFGQQTPASTAATAQTPDTSLGKKTTGSAPQASLLDLLDAIAPEVSAQVATQVPTAPSDTDAQTGETLSPLQAFLAHAALEAGEHQARSSDAPAVQLMTIHAAKGLEFDAVFITGLEEGLFPHEHSVRGDKAALEEERRLMYVAITRARKRLYLSWAHSRILHGRTTWTMPSRFIDELPSASLKWLRPAPASSAHTTPPQAGVTPHSDFSHSCRTSATMTTSNHNTTTSSPNTPSAATAAWHQAQLASVAHGALRKAVRPSANTSSQRSDGIERGVTVFHTKFGQGRVLAVEGVGDQAKAHIDFPRHGQKWLALGVAKLTVV